jgi:transposase
MAELCAAYQVHPNQISEWKKQLVERAMLVFTAGAGATITEPVDLAPLHAKIGQLALENDFLERESIGVEVARCPCTLRRPAVHLETSGDTPEC